MKALTEEKLTELWNSKSLRHCELQIRSSRGANTVPAGGENKAAAATRVRRAVVGRRERRGRLKKRILIG